jgi:hypothetical protein
VVIRNGSGKAKESPFYNADGQLLPYRFDGFKPVRLHSIGGADRVMHSIHLAALSRHRPAGLRAFQARCRALLTVIHVVPGAFVTAGVADRRAEMADLVREIALSCHGCGSELT